MLNTGIAHYIRSSAVQRSYMNSSSIVSSSRYQIFNDATRQNRDFLSFVYSTTNFGDEVQSVAQLALIPEGASVNFIDRDRPKYRGRRRILIANGWYAQSNDALPFPDDVFPIFESVHISRSGILSKEVVSYLRKFEPIGCRDVSSVRILNSAGVEAYFSGCLTMTIGHSRALRREPSDSVLVVDAHLPQGLTYPPGAHDLLLKLVPQEILNRAEFFNQEVPEKKRFSYNKKFWLAESFIKKYARARMVITSRLHCALPCISLGVPVLFLHNNYYDDPRFDGLRDILNGYGPDDNSISFDFEFPTASSDVQKMASEIVHSIQRKVQAVSG